MTAQATVPWRLERLDNDTERLVIRFQERIKLPDWVADLLLLSAVAICVLMLWPILDRYAIQAFATPLFALPLLVRYGRARQPVETVIDFTNGLAYYRYRRRWAATVRHYPLAAYDLVLSHPWGEGAAVGVYLSGRDGEFEVARFRAPPGARDEILRDPPAATALRALLAERLKLRQLGIV